VTVRSAGGGAANPAWTELRRRELGVPMFPALHSHAAIGAAKLARFGITGILHQESS
jgi:sugar (pentulose or hexulose) kinase